MAKLQPKRSGTGGVETPQGSEKPNNFILVIELPLKFVQTRTPVEYLSETIDGQNSRRLLIVSHPRIHELAQMKMNHTALATGAHENIRG